MKKGKKIILTLLPSILLLETKATLPPQPRSEDTQVLNTAQLLEQQIIENRNRINLLDVQMEELDEARANSASRNAQQKLVIKSRDDTPEQIQAIQQDLAALESQSVILSSQIEMYEYNKEQKQKEIEKLKDEVKTQKVLIKEKEKQTGMDVSDSEEDQSGQDGYE